MNKKICIVLVDRANYGRMLPVMREIKKHNNIELQIICAGTMLLERFGNAQSLVESDGFEISSKVFLEVEGSNPETMTKSIGIGIVQFSSELSRLSPDILLVIGDRYETLAAVISAAYMNIFIAHIQGGEVSGSIDESARHAITKFSHLHFASTERSARYIVKMGEDPKYVFNVGCPSGDYMLKLKNKIPSNFFGKIGVGAKINSNKPYLLVIFHPVTTSLKTQKEEASQLINALEIVKLPTIWIWPNADAGSESISKTIRTFRENKKATWLHLVKNIDPVNYQIVLKNALCAIGNSSSFVRDSSFFGTPIVLIGNRQTGREHGDNVIHCEPNAKSIERAINLQISKKRYLPSKIYGIGNASKKIISILKTTKLYNQKKLHYIFNDTPDI